MTQSYRAARAFGKRGFVSALSDLIWPPRSLLCEKIADRAGVIEPELWGALHFLGAPQCSRCGFSLPEEVGETAVYGACAGREPAYDTARAALTVATHRACAHALDAPRPAPLQSGSLVGAGACPRQRQALEAAGARSPAPIAARAKPGLSASERRRT